MHGSKEIASAVVVVINALPLSMINAKKQVFAYPILLSRQKFALFSVGENVNRFVYLKIFHDLVVPLKKNI